MNLNFVILCGGSGSRLWPLSREKYPKQLLSLVNNNTMLQNTILRVKNFYHPNINYINITLICNKEHYFIIQKQIEELKLDLQVMIITEPIARDTAPAVAIASLIGNTNDLSVIIPCDHVFDDNVFLEILKDGINNVNNKIVTFGILPTEPNTGYGYIKCCEVLCKLPISAESNINNSNNIKITEKFVEKPNLETAQKYINEGNYYWNAGVFLFENKTMLQCFQKYANDILEICTCALGVFRKLQTPASPLSGQALQGSAELPNIDSANNIIHLNYDVFSKCRAISVDYQIMENLCNDTTINIERITIPYTSTWSDIGSFSALHQYFIDNNNHINDTNANLDNLNNICKGDIISLNTQNCYIESNSLVATINLNNIIIVNTPDALLVADKNSSQDVKKIVDILKKENREERLHHHKVYRPWGYYENIYGNDNSGYKVKKIVVYPYKKLSLQSHEKRSEHWVITKGLAKVQVGKDTLILHPNQHVYIPKETLHRMENIGDELVEFTETQIGEYLGEDDIVRYEDDFGRI